VPNPIDGFRSKDGQAIAAVIQIERRKQAEFDFGQDQRDGNGAPVDFTGNNPSANVPSAVITSSKWRCITLRKSDRAESDVDFAQCNDSAQPVERAQMKNCSPPAKRICWINLSPSATRPFKKAFLVQKEARSNSNFSRAMMRRRKARPKSKKPEEPRRNSIFTGQTPIGDVPSAAEKL